MTDSHDAEIRALIQTATDALRLPAATVTVHTHPTRPCTVLAHLGGASYAGHDVHMMMETTDGRRAHNRPSLH